MASQTDYYEVLGVSKTASAEEIRKSYKKMAQQWHPDKNRDRIEEATEMFKNISEASAVLSDPEKRAIYDKHGIDGLKEHDTKGHGGVDPFEMFSHMFGGMQQNNNFPDLKMPIKVTLEDLYTGKTIETEIERTTFCNKCNGKGTKHGIEGNCKTCKGQGSVMMMLGPNQIFQSGCKSCKGTGVDPSVEKCKKCNGSKFYKEKANIPVNVPKGAYNKYPIVIDGEGHAVPPDEISDVGRIRSNAVFFVIEKDHPVFQRGLVIPEKGKIDFSDLMIDLHISLAESLCGFYREIKHLDNHKVQFLSKDPCRHGDIFVIKNEGMPKVKKSEFGDLFVRIDVEHPSEFKLTDDTKHKLGKLLHLKTVDIPTDIVPVKLIPFSKYKLDAKIQTETNNMKGKYDRRKNGGTKDTSDSDSDDDGGNDGGPMRGQQCQMQ